jgi:hypothetical protein
MASQAFSASANVLKGDPPTLTAVLLKLMGRQEATKPGFPCSPGPLLLSLLITNEKPRLHSISLSPLLQGQRGRSAWAPSTIQQAKAAPGVVKSKAERTGGHTPWTEQTLSTYRRRWPLDTRQRLAVEIMVNLGLRRSDAYRVGPNDIRGGSLTPLKPRSRNRSSLRMRFMCANRISTFLRSRRDCLKACTMGTHGTRCSILYTSGRNDFPIST